ncbi:MAG TPA: hypothetical protein VJ917_09450 [Saprospiraceae bacterium]|nr:hypothetical protein [Saprospiraceae bacterium]
MKTHFYFQRNILRPGILQWMVLFSIFFSLTYCSSSKKMAGEQQLTNTETSVRYTEDIQFVIGKKCTPCHFPERGRVKFLDTYQAVKNNADEILRRVQLDSTHEEFMPFKNKRPALTQEEIALLENWVQEGKPR